MTPHKYEPRCRSCEMQPTDVAFLSAHPDEPLQTVYNAVQSLGSQQARPEEQTVKHAPGPLYTTVPEILAHMRDVLSHMGNGDYLIARIDEVLAARAIELENIAGENRKLRAALMAVQFPESQQAPPERSQGQPEADLPPERHIDTPDELLELLAGISSDPQVEGLSLAQKASTMALLHIAKATQQNADMQRTALNYLMERSPEPPLTPLIRVHSQRRLHRQSFEAHLLARRIMERVRQSGSEDEKTVDITLMIRGEDPIPTDPLPLTIEHARDLARKLLIHHAAPTIQEIGELLVECDRHARQPAVQSPDIPQEPS